MRVQSGNLLHVTAGIIGHQVNCQRKAGAGLADDLRRMYPNWFVIFAARQPVLGECHLTPIKPGLIIADLYGQLRYGTGQQTDYLALRSALQRLGQLAYDRNLAVYLPYRLGCGHGGGDWSVVENLIRINVPQATVLRLEGV
ncbi:MAG: Appr-1-p processing protein [Xanthomonadales bacterium]|nr:Appr-1-p processing protein [Xanthomonadales bacterium]